MKALSLTQPWAWLVLHGGKNIENRRWNTQFRGEFLLHAAKGMKRADYESAQQLADQLLGYQFAHDMPLPEQLERGGIVGVAELFDVVPPEKDLPESFRGSIRWHFPEQFGFRLRNVRPLPFLPCKGALGFWGNFEIRDGKAVQL
jgi:hypothetical protein